MKKLLFLIFCLSAAQLGWAQDYSTLPPINASILDSLIGNKPSSDEPGFALGISRGSEILLEHYHGLADLENKIPISDITQFNLASVSKHFTAFGILFLRDRGKMNLNTPIVQYLNDFPYSERITPMQLLHHSSGIPSSDNLRVFAGLSLESDWGKREELRLHSKYRKLNFMPGGDFLYSNSGYFFLSQLIEAQIGLSYSDFFEKSLFPSMGIQGWVLDKSGKDIPNLAYPYKPVEGGFERKFPEKTTITGESNIYLNLPSLMRWMQYLLLSHHAESHFSFPMFSSSYKLPSGRPVDYSFGLEKGEINTLQTLTHGGGVPGYSSYVIYIPELDLGISVLSNSEKLPKSPGAIAHSIARYLTAEFALSTKKIAHTEIELTSVVTQKYVGEYRFWDGAQFEIKQDKGGLYMYLPDAPPFQLVPESDSLFFFREFDGQVAFRQKNGVMTLELIQGKKVDPAEKLNPNRQKAQSPTPSQLLGHYENKGLDVTYEVQEKEGKLFLVLPETLLQYAGFREVELLAIEGNTFRTRELGIIEWEMNPKGKVIGFLIKDVGRLRNLHFTKKS
ncbi:serine hydrolase domain-containing protein [Aquiflexum gelatinilyticum]|uniref:serine hydrolase domain-containing protein n=1 Tax=Aquiflexum gelatinilyticum TaxID=2961943 RepID=UPI0021694086|nr:serine hydrolase [Aquiflexum gelatinilyticum]MCS4436173.1 beta-lactamase family protein [Aquiflexum gelatinilyticum]